MSLHCAVEKKAADMLSCLVTDFATKRNLDPVFGFDGLLCGFPGILLSANTVQRSGRRMVPADDADSPPYGREQYF